MPAVGYAVALLAFVLMASRVPVVGQLVELVPGAIRYVALPAAGGWALNAARVDGRPPHHVLFAAARHRLRPRTLARLGPAPAVGARLAPVGGVGSAPAGDDDRYRRGRVRGPATVVMRYPAELALERVRPFAGTDPAARLTSIASSDRRTSCSRDRSSCR